MNQIVINGLKSAGTYAATAGLAWVASRYHLSGEQVAAIMADLGAVVAAAGGVYMHHAAGKKEEGE